LVESKGKQSYLIKKVPWTRVKDMGLSKKGVGSPSSKGEKFNTMGA
jgi:hypothetical protein